MRREFPKTVKRDAAARCGGRYLAECFNYDPETGDLRWRHRPQQHFSTASVWRCFNSRDAGRRAGSPNSSGYLTVRLDQKLLYAHRIAWEMGTGHAIPDGMVIDHKNGIVSDNRLANLRLATKSENAFNSKGARQLPKGVYYNPDRGDYSVSVRANGVAKRARVSTLSEAVTIAAAFREQMHGAFGRTC